MKWNSLHGATNGSNVRAADFQERFGERRLAGSLIRRFYSDCRFGL
jgi:hypothetical protein